MPLWFELVYGFTVFCNHSFQSRSTIYNLSSESEHLCHPTLHLQLSKWVLLLRWLYRDNFLRSLAASQWEKKRKSYGAHERPSLSESLVSTDIEASTEAEQPVSSSTTAGSDTLTFCSLQCHTVVLYNMHWLLPFQSSAFHLCTTPCLLFLSSCSLPLLVFLSIKTPVMI